MDEKLSEENGQAVPAHKEEEEEMEVTMTSQLENLIVTPTDVDATADAQTLPEESGDVQTGSAAAAPFLDGVCKVEECEGDDSDDSDRYLHTHTLKQNNWTRGSLLMFLDQTCWFPIFCTRSHLCIRCQ